MVLSATLAIGSCQLAACGETEPTPEPPPLASTLPAPVEETVPEDAEPDVDAEDGRVGELDLAPGFVPDPMTRTGTTAGGPVDVHEFDDRCEGWIGATPDMIVRTTRPIAELTVMAASDEDLTLMMIGPDGEPACADDEDGSHPSIRRFLPPGTHRVWVGTREPQTTVPFVVAVSELDDSAPSSLLH